MNKFISITLLLTLPFSVMAATPKLDTNELLYQYCDTGSSEFEQSVTVGQGTKVMYHQGPFMQVSATVDNQALVELIQGKLTQSDLSNSCTQFLLSRAVIEDENQTRDLVARVLFDFDKDELNKQSRYLLLKLGSKLEQQVPELSVVGNTDSKGSGKYNLSLGLKRSESVVTYLREHGVPVEQITVTSQGEKAPIQSNDLETGRHLNRRVDIQS
ncbi:OmpA family protein [Vibrio crassostreae]|uniref:OmpA family protein n=1 Tax=Vibrio crassostreae TaxID=246167 RepID=UPI001053E623|nr:OmpA family protein [Vibrio crassostreae]TCN63956.1 OmpA family protein [Vibrio crassostreae]